MGTIEEETIVADVGGRSGSRDLEPERLDEVSSGQEARIDLCDSELNRVLGAGLVRGTFVLLAENPE